jgi:hypothetical protein
VKKEISTSKAVGQSEDSWIQKQRFIWRGFLAAALLAPILVVAVIKCLPRSERQLFDEVAIGMHRSEVEHLLGNPRWEFSGTAYYGESPRIELWHSPQSLSRITVDYTEDRVTEKAYYKDQKLRLHEKLWLKVKRLIDQVGK